MNPDSRSNVPAGGNGGESGGGAGAGGGSGGEDLSALVGQYIDRLTEGEDIDPQVILERHGALGPAILKELETFVDFSRSRDGDADGAPLGTLGDYTLRRQLGRGGMGVVYEAWENSMDRRVALKVLPVGVAADDRAFQRFMREARTAGKLSHPNVVPVYATGIKDQTPYYAMEYIEGETLAQVIARLREARGEGPEALGPVLLSFTPLLRDFESAETMAPGTGGSVAEALKSGAPTTLERLLRTGEIDLIYCASLARAFAGVAEGLEHAHRKGIVHRDLKPSNLIFDSGGCPRPGEPAAPGGAQVRLRILDFGLARQEGQESLTASGDFLGTVLYMSPEQAMAKRIPIDKRTDIYSLGATMYEALTWRPPFQGKNAQDTLSQIIFRDPAPPRKLNPRIPRDLETVVLKCLRKDPQDRYGTAEALAQDLQRFVRGDAIEARPQGQWERWARRLWRYRKAVFAAVTIALILVTGLIASSVLIWREKENTRRALVRADQNYEKARGAVEEMLTEVGETWLADIPGMEEVRRSLLQKALKFYEGSLAERGDDPDVRREAGMAQMRMGDILERLGRHAESEGAYRKAVAAFGDLAAEFPGEPAREHDIARALRGLSGVLAGTGRRAEAKEALEKEKGILEKLAARVPAEAAYREDLASAEDTFGGFLSGEGKHQEAESAYCRAIEIRSALIEQSPSKDKLLMAQASSHMSLSHILWKVGVVAKADEGLWEALKLTDRIGEEARRKPDCLGLLAGLRQRLGGVLGRKDMEAAEREYRDYLQLRQKLADDFPYVPAYRSELAIAHLDLADALQGFGKPAEVEQHYTESASILRRLVDLHPDVPGYKLKLRGSINNYALWLHSSGKDEEAKSAFLEVIRINEALARDHPETPDFASELAMMRSNFGIMLVEHGGDREEAEKQFAEGRDALRKLHEEFPRVHKYAANLAQLSINLARVFIYQGRNEEAEKALREAVEIQEGLLKSFPDAGLYQTVLDKALSNLGEVLVAEGRLEEARKCLDRAIEGHERLIRKDPRNAQSGSELFVFVRNAVGRCLSAGDPARAEELLRRAASFFQKLKEEFPEAAVDTGCLRFLLFNLAGILYEAGRLGEAEDACRKGLALEPVEPEALSLMARILAARAKEEPEKLAQEEGGREDLAPEKPAAEKPAGSKVPASKVAKSKLAEALRLATKATELAPGKPETWTALGMARYRAGDWEKSIEALEKAVELGAGAAGQGGGHGVGPGEWFLLGMACWQAGERKKAVTCHERALDLVDAGGGTVSKEAFDLRQEAEGLLGLRELEVQRHVRAGDYEKAEEALRDVVRFWETVADESAETKARSRHLGFAYMNLGQVLDVAGRPADAEDIFRKAVALEPEDADALGFLAGFLAARPGQTPEKLAEAVRLAEKAAENSPQDAGVWNTLGLARYRWGEWQGAASALEKSMDLSEGGDPSDWLITSMARWRLGEKEEAAKWYQKAVEAMDKGGGEDGAQEGSQDGSEGVSEKLEGLRKEAEALLGVGGGKAQEKAN